MSEIEPAAPVLLTDLETEFHMSKTVGGDGHLPRGIVRMASRLGLLLSP
jgi:hypothetical protein